MNLARELVDLDLDALLARPMASFAWRRAPRRIQGLLSAQTTRRQVHSPRKLKGKAAEGIRYERRVGKFLESAHAGREVLAGQWILFEDSNGVGAAQPDYLVFDPPVLWIYEAKLTHTELAADQLLGLYEPLCRYIWSDLAPVCVEICKNPNGRGGLISKPEEVYERPDAGWHVLHWLGR